MTSANPQNRLRVICDLTAQEYEEQQRLAEANPQLHPPLIEILSQVPPHHRINEDHIGRIAADGWAAATHGLDMSDQDQQSIEHAALSWPTDRKLRFLTAVAEHWMPPHQDESSWWHGNARSAATFLYQFPEPTSSSTTDQLANYPKNSRGESKYGRTAPYKRPDRRQQKAKLTRCGPIRIN